MELYSGYINKLIDELAALPGIGNKSAQRLAFYIIGMSPQRVVYVSCDPATLGRDIKIFAGFGYQAVRAAAVDMFPGTRHVETVVLLSK